MPIDFGRIEHHDPRNFNYPVTLLLDDVPRKSRTWRRPAPYDQIGPTCVANTGKGLVNTTPTTKAIPAGKRLHVDADGTWYRGAQEHDQWPGINYDGTSALGMCEYLRFIGLISGYYWCTSLDQALDCLGQRGAIGIGVSWKTGMMRTDADGFIHVTGGEEGGHEVEVNGIDVRRRTVTITNSWGADWGVNGRCKLTWDDLGQLLDDGGDAVTLVPA